MPKKCDEELTPFDKLAFGQRVYLARCDAHLQVKQVADALGVTDIFIRQIELGKRLPSLPVFSSLCNILRVSPAYLLSSELKLSEEDPVQMAIDLLSGCTPRQGVMLIDALSSAKKHV